MVTIWTVSYTHLDVYKRQDGLIITSNEVTVKINIHIVHMLYEAACLASAVEEAPSTNLGTPAGSM